MFFALRFGLTLALAGAAGAPAPAPPKTPPGLEPCTTPLQPNGELTRSVGETVRYLVDVNGLSVGTVDFRIEKRGTFDGQPVTEYRSLFKIDNLVAAAIPVEGRAATLVPDAGSSPAKAMSRYKLDKNEFEEDLTYAPGGRAVSSHRSKNGRAKDESRAFPGPVLDFVSSFYTLRTLALDTRGCAIIYSNQRAYTVWIEPDGEEDVMTPVGLKPAERYAITFASEKSKKPVSGRLWLGAAPDRLPYRAELRGKRRLEARIHLFENGAAVGQTSAD